MVVDREEDEVSLADDEPDVVGTHVLGDRRDRQTSPAEHLGQGLGLVRAQGVIGEQLPRPVRDLVGVTVDEDEERSRLRAEREVPDERRQQLAPDAAQSDEHDPLRHRSHRPSDPTR